MKSKRLRKIGDIKYQFPAEKGSLPLNNSRDSMKERPGSVIPRHVFRAPSTRMCKTIYSEKKELRAHR